MSNVTATDITVALACKHRDDFFLTEVKSGSTWFTPAGDMKRLDGLAIRKSWTSPCFTGYEVKVSRSDFLRDAKFYTYEELCNCLYIVCPKGMINRTELPESVGLMYYDPEKQTLQTKKKAIYRKIEYNANMLLYIIYSRLDSDHYPFYSDKREYFEAYVAEKITTKELGCRVSSRLARENAELHKQIDKMYSLKNNYALFTAIMEVLRKHWIWIHKPEDVERLDEVLSSKEKCDLSFVRKNLEWALKAVIEMDSSIE